jgi:hypothetical protein
MTDNVIYGIDFRAGKEEAPLCSAPDENPHRFVQPTMTIEYGPFTVGADTAPSEYCAPDGDCA